MTPSGDGVTVDATVAAKWYLRDETLRDDALYLLQDIFASGMPLLEPAHMPAEVGNAILRARRLHRLTDRQMDEAFVSFERLLVRLTITSPERFVHTGARLAMQLGTGYYDACYLAVARVHGVRLVTADERFFRQAGAEPDVVWLGNYRPGM